MRADIRFAGMTLGWTEEYAKNYASVLKEMGYCIRITPAGPSFLIAYSYKTFNVSEMQECLEVFEREAK